MLFVSSYALKFLLDLGLIGSGRDLFKAVRLAYSGIVPRKEWAFVECSATDFLSNPYVYGEKGVWVGKPDVES